MKKKYINLSNEVKASDFYDIQDPRGMSTSEYDDYMRAKQGQKEQDKNKYSDSDMTNYALYILHNDVITPKEWFEQFKNK